MSERLDFFGTLERELAALQHADADEARIRRVYALTSQCFILASAEEPLHFTTLFARITHVCTKRHIPGRWTTVMQRFRIDAETIARKGTPDRQVSLRDIWIAGAHALHEIATRILEVQKSVPTAEMLGSAMPVNYVDKRRPSTFKRTARLLAYAVDADAQVLVVSDAETAEAGIRLSYGHAGRSELYRENIQLALDLIGLPFALSAIDIEIDTDGTYSPRTIVLEPDYLLDVSTIAECYSESGGDVRLYIPKKFQEQRSTVPILMGKIINYFLDELIHDPERTFNELFPRTFYLNPIEFSTLDNHTIIRLQQECEMHYRHLQRVVKEDFHKLGLIRERMFIEPAFFSPTYGIQGRLDLFQSGIESRDIIELKSGQAFMANAYGLSSTHYAQTLLYDLMIKSVYQFRSKQTCYVLYSKYNERSMRHAPPVEAIQREVIRLRNDMLLAEVALAKQRPDTDGWFERIDPDAFPDQKGFIRQEINEFHQTWQGLSDLEKRYVRIFSRFIASEHFLAKVGIHGSDQVNGLAALWLETDTEKEERFAIYRNLRVEEIFFKDHNNNTDAYIRFQYPVKSSTLVNFRVGDIAVLYPIMDDVPGVLHSQIHKCTVTHLGNGQVTIRLRSRQINYDDISAHDRWALEHDLYDRSFNSMHSALFRFARYEEERRRLFLGLQAPAPPAHEHALHFAGLDGQQRDVLARMIRAQDYFLLWGPPGTGKTSVILHHLVRHYLESTSDRMVLLAYTNRAVDEICQALDAIGGDIRERYVRIGSHISTGEDFADQLLGNRISGMRSRREVVKYLTSQRIIVGTISSIAAKPELFKIVQAQIAIVDEASQILEPVLAGLLPEFQKWILIGDHRQLPAVVAQPAQETTLGDDGIPEIDLVDTRDSYFERMYTIAQRRNWHWAYGVLHEQGRMHARIMDFPGRVFYQNLLQLLPSDKQGSRDFTGPLPATTDSRDPLTIALAGERMLWIPSSPSGETMYSKTHDDEARIVSRVVGSLQEIYGYLPEIGIITPFRAQIANIRAHLQEAGIDPDALTIDTVERYQGSARDIIVLSLSVHHPAQLHQVSSLSREGIDRKLNVALTRAREQFVFIASGEALEYNEQYRALCNACFRLDYDLVERPLSREVSE